MGWANFGVGVIVVGAIDLQPPFQHPFIPPTQPVFAPPLESGVGVGVAPVVTLIPAVVGLAFIEPVLLHFVMTNVLDFTLSSTPLNDLK
jgi:hypothetical protein